MIRDSQRRERTLPARPTPPVNDDMVAGSPTVLELPSLRIEPTESPEQPEPSSASSAARGGPVEPETRDRDSRWRRGLRVAAKVLVWMAVSPFLCILPFIVVLRISVLAYQESAYDGWESLGAGLIAAVLLVCIYIGAFMWSFSIPRRLFMPFLTLCLMAMLCYSGYALFHLATGNAKTAEVRSYYTSLHPFLRIAVTNLMVVDPDLVITDTHRTKAQYRSMGLRPREYSLHFRQPTGFVHAMDLRTKDRPRVENLLVELYFVLMGFNVIRHVGTADHLHVALPLSPTDMAKASAGSRRND